MIDFYNFLHEVFGDINPNNNIIFARLLIEGKYRAKHPITCDTPSKFYKRLNRVDLINGDPEKEVTLIGSQEDGPLFFVSSNKDPRTGEVNRVWADGSNKIYSLSWPGPNDAYLLFTVATLDSSFNIVNLEINLYDKKALEQNEISDPEDIAEILSKRELVHPVRSDLIPDVSFATSSEEFPRGVIPYSILLDHKSLASRVLPNRKHKLMNELMKALKGLRK